MIVIPDLFGSYQKGREAAIEANWKDLSNYESIESSRHQNDAQALANLATMVDFGKKRQMVSNDTATSDLNLQLLAAQQPAKLNIAKGDEIYTGVQLGTMVNNMDLLTSGLANQFGTWYYGTDTANKNARVANDKATIGADVSAATYPYMRQSAFNKTMSDIDVQNIASQWNPLIAELTYPTQYFTAGTAYDTAKVNRGYAEEIAKAQNIASLLGLRASASGSEFADLTNRTNIIAHGYNEKQNIDSAIAVLEQQLKGVEQGSNDWKNIMGRIETLRAKSSAIGEALGYDYMNINFNPVYNGSNVSPNATKGSTTYVDPSTGRAITVPYATTGVGPLASGYVTYGSNGTNLFTGSSQPRTLSEITANLTTPRQNVMGVPNIGNVPNSALVKPATTVRHNLPNGQVWYTTAPVRQVQPMPSQGQVIKNFNNRRGIL